MEMKHKFGGPGGRGGGQGGPGGGQARQAEVGFVRPPHCLLTRPAQGPFQGRLRCSALILRSLFTTFTQNLSRSTKGVLTKSSHATKK